MVRSVARDHLPHLSRLATQLTGDPSAAQRLVADTVVEWSQSRPGVDDVDPETQLRTALVRRFLRGGWRRAAANRTRAGLVLLVAEGLTRAEVAAVIDAPPSKLPGSADAHPTEEFERLATAAPDVDSLQTAIADAERTRTGRRRRTGVLAAVAAGLVALVVAVPALVLPRLPHETRQVGEWTLVHEVQPPDGWRVIDRTVSREVEGTIVEFGGETTGELVCGVSVFVAGSFKVAGLGADPEPVRVRGRPGFRGTIEDGMTALAWEFGRGAWAVVACPAEAQDADLVYEMASAVRFRRSSIQLPFGLGPPPEGYRIEAATDALAGGGADVILAKPDLVPGEADINVTFARGDRPSDTGSTRALSINGRRAVLDNNPENPRLCVAEQEQFVCLTAFWPDGDWPRPAPPATSAGATLIEVARGLRFAPALDDRDSWFTGEQALP